MSVLNFFSDPKLRTRQDQLNGQWNSLWAVYQACDQTPDSAFSEFATDLRLWREFYDGGNDWSSSSANATNEWQNKAMEWSQRLTDWGCTGNQSSDQLPNNIPTVKVPPPDETSVLDDAKGFVSDKVEGIWSRLATAGWVVVGLFVLLIGGIIYLLTHVTANTPYGSISK